MIASYIDLQHLAQEYLKSLTEFFDKNAITSLLHSPIDHLAIKAKDTQEYEKYLQLFSPLSISISYSPMNNRRIATAKLRQSISFGQLGNSFHLEILEPKPEKMGVRLVGFEHIEIYNQDLAAVQAVLEKRQVPIKPASNTSHNAIVLQINDKGQELKFTDKRLELIVEKELQEGKAIKIK